MAMMIERMLYSALIESSVVKVPVPAIKGNARGTTEAAVGTVSLLICTPRIISNATIKMSMEPAIAKSPMEMPIISSMEFPTKRNVIIMQKETKEAFAAFIDPLVCFNVMITGIEPMMSITANNTMVTLRISTRSKTILQN